MNCPHFLDYFFFYLILMLISKVLLTFFYDYVKIIPPVQTDKLDDRLIDVYCLMNSRRKMNGKTARMAIK